MNRWRDWWAQAQRDLDHAEHALADGDFEWAAFASHQAAEKGLKALILEGSGEPWGHSLALLVEALPASAAIGQGVSEAAHRLDKHYIPARYPNGLAAGYPGKLYTADEAREAISHARTILDACGRGLS